MSGQKKPIPSSTLTWPMVALAVVVLVFLFGIFRAIPADEPAGRTALLGLLTSAGFAVIAFFQHRQHKETSDKLDEVHDMVNGNTSRLLDKIPDAERPPGGVHRAE